MLESNVHFVTDGAIAFELDDFGREKCRQRMHIKLSPEGSRVWYGNILSRTKNDTRPEVRFRFTV